MTQMVSLISGEDKIRVHISGPGEEAIAAEVSAILKPFEGRTERVAMREATDAVEAYLEDIGCLVTSTGRTLHRAATGTMQLSYRYEITAATPTLLQPLEVRE